jgi:hypothetical protein
LLSTFEEVSVNDKRYPLPSDISALFEDSIRYSGLLSPTLFGTESRKAAMLGGGCNCPACNAWRKANPPKPTFEELQKRSHDAQAAADKARDELVASARETILGQEVSLTVKAKVIAVNSDGTATLEVVRSSTNNFSNAVNLTRRIDEVAK